MKSTLFDEHPYLLHQLLFFPVDVSIIVITYLNIIRLIVMSFFGLFDRVFQGWDPGSDTHTPSIWRIMHRRPKHSPQDHCCNLCQKRYNHQWDRRHVYPFQLCHIQYQPPDIVPNDYGPTADMPILLSAFCIAAVGNTDSNRACL